MNEVKPKFFEGRLARLTARLFWMLPEGAHDWLEHKTGGWRVIVWTKPVTASSKKPVLSVEGTDFEIDAYCWEYWPESKPIRTRRG